MYFNDVEKFQLEELIVNNEKIYAHVMKERKEILKEHVELAIKYLYKIIEVKQLHSVLLNFEKNICKEMSTQGKLLYREMLFNTIYMHDLGKINCNFQYNRMNNKEFKGKKGLDFNNSNHSMLSSIIYLNHYFNRIKEQENKDDRSILAIVMLLNAYAISKHHGGFDSFGEFKSKLLEKDGEGWRLYTEELSMFNEIYQVPIIFNHNKNLLNRIFSNVEKSLKDKEKKQRGISIYFYIYQRFVASLLLACDYYATSEFKNQREIKDFGEIENINHFYQVYKNTEICKGIRTYEKESYGKTNDFNGIQDINILRNELFLEAEKNLLKNIEKNIFYLEAPTGSGKSNVGFNLSFKLIENLSDINKIFYVYPFNTLVEQNMNTLKKTFEDSAAMKDIAIINSVVPIKTKNRTENEDSDVMKDDYEISFLDRQFLHYPMILTTHISIFNYLFGTSKDNLFPLYQLANSIIILDEIQSYKNRIWKEIITFLKYYSEALNIKFIIMSATLPDLNKLIDEETETINLVENRDKYFSNSIFKDRVKLDFSLLELQENTMEGLLKHVLETGKKTEGNILIEFITKKSAMKFFKKLKEENELSEDADKKEIELITGDDNSIDRNAIIAKVKANKNIILVATQVIEAGVDIDMDVGYKDISMLDAEEQFLGRINRSCMKKNCKVYFFDLDDASKIYKNDVRKEKSINLTAEKIRNILIDKNFGVFYKDVLQKLEKEANKLNDNNFYSFIEDNIKGLNFKKIEERMKLIDEHYRYSVFLSRRIELENNKILNGEEVWKEYITLLKNNDLEYAEKKIKLSRVTASLNHFIYKVQKNDFTYQERIGDLYYITDGERYFVDGKFDRENFDKGIGDFI
ncbi:CRISPR-associated helicase/endonuclease Cas3 [Clostridium formicaceticum]|uniref:CRISPR-associated helicase/endonuclease Cas3 n=1 Tax=Clostridium formicaceticum TaxID=1497 RepID=A0AAC9RM64_9CLOT|nr:CRISPR-associated helicase/endonuclease Cas3 [Clostridium formicaceticum]AOY76430.1 CRISPR-associated helicase/endonuclease Cas3 [Clostridium formicaceticum]ARE86825.1 helicase Cas3 [Clostridium formicaceticum]